MATSRRFRECPAFDNYTSTSTRNFPPQIVLFHLGRGYLVTFPACPMASWMSSAKVYTYSSAMVLSNSRASNPGWLTALAFTIGPNLDFDLLLIVRARVDAR